MIKKELGAARDAMLRRRISKTINNEPMPEKAEPNLLQSQKDMNIENVINKIGKMNSLHCTRCELTLEDKYTIIEHISEKENISYNRNTFIALMTVWKCPALTYYENSLNKCKIKDEINDSIFDKRCLKNFFLLQGQVFVYQREPEEENYLSSMDEGKGYEATFETQSQFESLSSIVDKLEPKLVLNEGHGWGPIFKNKDEENGNLIMKVCNAIIIEVKAPELENMLINLGGLDQEKKYKIIEAFPIFSSISKKIQSILPFMQLKKYSKKEYIYKTKQQPQSVYLVLKGEVIFEVKIELPQTKKDNNSVKSVPNEFMIHTEALGVGNYFGEEEIVYKKNRTLNSVCNSAECDLLEIPVEKFEKLLTYSDFYEEVKESVDIKIAKREEKIQKAKEVYSQFKKSPEKYPDDIDIKTRRNSFNAGDTRKSPGIKSSSPVKIMHGNIIRTIPKEYGNETVNFSMLKANPDMYASTMKKFRKYTMKQPEKYKPDVNWNLKRVWKVLNLESILREDTEVASPEGIKFFETSRRLQNHVQENKSMRPKTSSSTYRTKLQYIAYLQQFNN